MTRNDEAAEYAYVLDSEARHWKRTAGIARNASTELCADETLAEMADHLDKAAEFAGQFYKDVT